jgi:hypothetical protein
MLRVSASTISVPPQPVAVLPAARPVSPATAERTVTPARAPPTSLSPPLTVGRTQFQRIGLGDLQAGDIGFQVQRHQRNFRQFWITVGGHWAAWRRKRHTPTNPWVVHTFIVVQPHPERLQVHTIDGAGDNYTGINHVCMDFVEKVRVVPGGRYIFFRARDLALRSRILEIASNWAAPNSRNFGVARAVAGPFHSTRFDARAARRTLHLYHQAGVPRAPRRQRGQHVFKMSCSEFVFNVIASAAMTQWQARHPRAAGEAVLQGLCTGPLGGTFAVDAKGVHPPHLAALLEDGRFWRPVGYVTEDG